MEGKSETDEIAARQFVCQVEERRFRMRSPYGADTMRRQRATIARDRSTDACP